MEIQLNSAEVRAVLKTCQHIFKPEIFDPKTLKVGQLYEFRGQQLRYSHSPQCKVQERYVFFDSLDRRCELGAKILKQELIEIGELAEN